MKIKVGTLRKIIREEVEKIDENFGDTMCVVCGERPAQLPELTCDNPACVEAAAGEAAGDDAHEALGDVGDEDLARFEDAWDGALEDSRVSGEEFSPPRSRFSRIGK